MCSISSRDALRSKLLRYQYQAPALSLLERNGLDAFWNFCAQRIYPLWLAPNLITITGGLCVGLATALTFFHSPMLAGSAPRWVYGCDALLIFCYQTLDGSDGKQARRTKSGSPVGELLDHGIDAWACGCVVAVCLDAFGFGIQSLWPWIILLGAQSAFFASNLTLVKFGCMRVDDMGVIELQTTMCGCLLTTAAITPAAWAARSLQAWLAVTVENRELLGLITLTIMAWAVASPIWQVLAGPGPRDETLRLCRLMAVYVSCVSGTLVYILFYREDLVASRTMLHLLLLCANSCFAELMARILMLRVAEQPIPMVTPSLLALFGFAGAAVLGASTWVCVLAAGAGAAAHWTYFVRIARRSADALGIHLFRVCGARSWCRL